MCRLDLVWILPLMRVFIPLKSRMMRRWLFGRRVNSRLASHTDLMLRRLILLILLLMVYRSRLRLRRSPLRLLIDGSILLNDLMRLGIMLI